MVHNMADSKTSGFSKVVAKHSLRAKERVSVFIKSSNNQKTKPGKKTIYTQMPVYQILSNQEFFSVVEMMPELFIYFYPFFRSLRYLFLFESNILIF